MDVVILAGGKGSRMNHVLPKPLMEVAGKPILTYQLDYLLKSKEINKIILSIGYKSDEIKKFIDSNSKKYMPSKIEFSVEEQLLGTAGGLNKALPKTNTNYILVLNCDDITDINISKLSKIKENTICVAHPRLPFGLVKEKNNFAFFVEKPILDSWVSCGWYLLNRDELLKSLPEKGSLEYDVFPKMKMKLFKHGGFWSTFNTEKDIREFEEKDLPVVLRNSK
ncbi:MAG: nucleotidyltransferase family protein [Candidatus Aenigmarchaeota archaeon]|nr:nucleotidyltransferase family protein [Candidatus Aenigmarchaeota archaeon]